MIREILDRDPNSWTAEDKAELRDRWGPLGRLFFPTLWKLLQSLMVVVYFLALVFSIIRVAVYTLVVLIPMLVCQKAKDGRSWVSGVAVEWPKPSRAPRLNHTSAAKKDAPPPS